MPQAAAENLAQTPTSAESGAQSAERTEINLPSALRAPPSTPPPVAAAPTAPTYQPLPPDVGEPLSADSSLRTPHAALLKTVIDDALARLLLPALEREIRHELTEESESHAVAVFARNLRSLLLQPPLRQRRVLAIDPGFRGGCKVAVLDEHGNPLDDAVIHPHPKKPRPGRGQEAPADKGPAPPPAGETPANSGAENSPTPAPAAETAPANPGAENPPTPAPAAEAAPATADPAATPVSPVQHAPLPSESPVATIVPGVPSPESSPAPSPPAPEAQSVPAATAPPSPPVDKKEEARTKLRELVAKHQVQVFALGNGPGCRETEEFLADLISSNLPDLAYVIVNEAGAREYANSSVGREEFPNSDPILRGTISIGRRLQDPLSEFVKIDPQNIGVGLYQHDVRRRDVKETLEATVSSCVNHVGVDVNTAHVSLLRYVSGLNAVLAREIVEYRKQHGPFKNREQLLQLPGMGQARFTQAAGFLRVAGGDNPLDRTWIHPESYELTRKLLAELGYTPAVLEDAGAQQEFRAKLRGVHFHDMAGRLGAGAPTVQDLVLALSMTDSDPRHDAPSPILKKGVLKLEDLQPGMELKGTVLNVVDFGAFVDIGLKDSGLVHISQMANRYIKSPYEVVAVNDVVAVWVLTVDKERHRVSLTMIQPGTERKPGERRGPPPRSGSRPPPRGRRPEGQGQPGEARPPRGARPGGRGPRREPAPAGTPAGDQTAGSSAPAEAAASTARPAPPPRPPQPPRRPRREAPRPKLSQAALEGKVPLRTFGELSALFAAKQRKVEPLPPPAPPAASAPPPTPAPENPPPPPPEAGTQSS